MEIGTDSSGYGDVLAQRIIEASPALVCFDYFDTLVRRTVHPEDVKRIACDRVALVACPLLDGAELYAIRNRLEAEHCNRNEQAGQGDLEFRLKEVLGSLWDATQDRQEISRAHFVDLGRGIEIDLERSVQVLDREIVSAIGRLKDAGLRCWVVSDFYFDTEAFGQLLEHHGLSDLFERVEVSSDRMATKRSGKMFDAILIDSGLDPAQVMMVGDNPHSDVASPRSKGMMAIGIDRASQHARYEALNREKNDPLATQRHIKAILSRSDAVFPEMALTLHSFIHTLSAKLMRAGATDVFFLAREGQFLKKLFDAYQARRLTTVGRLKSHYLEVSRRATFLPSLQDLDSEDFHTLFRQYRRISVREFLSSLSLEDLADGLASRLAMDVDTRHTDLPSDPAFQTLIHDPAFRQAYEERRAAGAGALAAYLESFGASDPHGTLHVVDVGWKGTIQDNLHSFISRATSTDFRQLEGHYVGLVAAGSAGPSNTKDGLVFSNLRGQSRNYSIFAENRALFEVALGADHGSAHSYRLDEGGTPRAIRQPFAEESLFRTKIEPLQAKYFSLFTEIDELLVDRHLPDSSMRTFCAVQHARAVLAPTAAEIDWFTDVYHVENFGVFESSRFNATSASPGILAQLRFYLALRRTHGGQGLDMGFWPWLTCLQKGGSWVAKRYSASKLRTMEF